MTGRGTVALLLAIGIVALSAALPSLFWPGIAITLALATIIVIDGRRAPGEAQLSVERTVNDIVSVGAPIPVTVVASARRQVRHARVRDSPPPEFVADQQMADGPLPLSARYSVIARARGEAHFGDIAVRVRGPWGLGWRQTSLPAGKTVDVNADLTAISTYQALARRGHLAELGVRTMRRRGEGSEFERIRDAVPDDPLRSINWRATARTGRLMAVDLIPERAQPVIICIDHGRLMGVGAGSLTKLDTAINASVLLVHVCLAAGDRAGLFAFNDRVTTQLSPASGRAQMTRFLDAVRPLRPGDTEADYDHALLRLAQWQKRRSLIAIFTDVIDGDQSEALARQCALLRRRHVPLVIAVRDPAVVDMARAAPNDAQSTYGRAIALTMSSERATALQRLKSAGAETIDADARTLSPAVVNRYLELKRLSRI